MKTLIKSLLVLLLITLGCKGKDTVEVIPDYDEIYLPVSKVDSAPKLINGNEKELSEKITQETKNLDMEGKVKLIYRLFINENGDVDKVEVVKCPDKVYTNIAVSQFENWKFEPAMKNNKSVKSQYRWSFNTRNKSNMAKVNPEDFLSEVDQMPEPIGGIKAILENVKYPDAAKESGIEGKVFVKAFINENGDVVGTEIIKGVDSDLDEAAEAAVMKTKFKPATHKGKNVKVQIVVPILFKLS